MNFGPQHIMDVMSFAASRLSQCGRLRYLSHRKTAPRLLQCEVEEAVSENA